jgi:hypothetical protein
VGTQDPAIWTAGGTSLVAISGNTGSIKLMNCLTLGCNLGNSQTTLQVAPTAITGAAPVFAIPSPAPANSPAPVGGCYNGDGNPCPSTMHSVYLTALLVTVASSNCTTGSVCTFSGGVKQLSGAANFSTPDGAWDVVCSVFAPINEFMTAGWVTGSPPSIQILSWLNETGGTHNIGVGEHVGVLCTGQ